MLRKGKPQEIAEANTGEIVNEHTDSMWKKGYHLKNLPNNRTHKAECMTMWGPMDMFFGSQTQTQPQEVEPDEPGAGHGAGGQDCDGSSEAVAEGSVEAVTVVEGEGAA